MKQIPTPKKRNIQQKLSKTPKEVIKLFENLSIFDQKIP